MILIKAASHQMCNFCSVGMLRALGSLLALKEANMPLGEARSLMMAVRALGLTLALGVASLSPVRALPSTLSLPETLELQSFRLPDLDHIRCVRGHCTGTRHHQTCDGCLGACATQMLSCVNSTPAGSTARANCRVQNRACMSGCNPACGR